MTAEGAPASFVDTQPNLGGSETGEGGDRQGGRRRNRRGGRGRDRDDVNGSEVNRDAQTVHDGESMPAAHDAPTALADADGNEPRVESGEAAIEDAGQPSDTRGEGSGNRRRRGGRGRDRGPREGGTEGEANEGAIREASAPTALAPDSSAHDVAESPMAAAHHEPDVAPAAQEPVAARMPLFEAHEEAPPIRHEPVLEAPRAPEAVAAAAPDYVLPIDSLQAVAGEAGLQWVNSDEAKIKAAQEAMAAMPAPQRTPREIRKVESVDTGPLVLVETKKDLSQVRLPFETQTPGA